MSIMYNPYKFWAEACEATADNLKAAGNVPSIMSPFLLGCAHLTTEVKKTCDAASFPLDAMQIGLKKKYG